MLRTNISSLLILLCSLTGLAQFSIESIKKNSNYYWAEGYGVTVDEANDDALGRISSQISTTITDQIEHHSNTISEGNKIIQHYSTTDIKKMATSVSSCLQNVEMRILKDEPDAIVFRYVLKSDVQKMFELRTQKIRDLVNAGNSAEKNLHLDDALRNYYWAFMLSRALPEPVLMTFEGDNVKRDCKTHIPVKIRSILSNIDVFFIQSSNENNRFYADLEFKYNGHDISSLQIHYFDGSSYVGPLSIRDGKAQLELQSLPSNKEISIRYEYAFREEAKNIDEELRAVFNVFRPIPIKTTVTIPVNVNVKKQEITSKKSAKDGVSLALDTLVHEVQATPTANIEKVETIQKKTIEKLDPTLYLNALTDIKSAIKSGNPEIAFKHFTPDGYEFLKTLIANTGTVRVTNDEDIYDFIEHENQIIARFIPISIKYKKGKAITENLTIRFNKQSGKIESLAFALTQKAEDDIFNAASQWPEVSRFTIMQFMEDYQTAYAFKRIDYLNQIFSDEALIISGTMLKKATKADLEGRVFIKTPYVKYKLEDKTTYIKRLGLQFKQREYINLKFEDNRTKAIRNTMIPAGTAFAIEIKQNYRSPVYSDKGYLTLLLDVSKRPAIIHARLWQPNKIDIELEQFIKSLKI